MDISGVDPRDCTWEGDDPVYRVYFWHQPRPPGLPDDAEAMYHSDEYRIVGATDVHEVIAWADGRLPEGRTYTLYAEVPAAWTRDGDPGTLLLAGVDPTVPTGPGPRQGMLSAGPPRDAD